MLNKIKSIWGGSSLQERLYSQLRLRCEPGLFYKAIEWESPNETQSKIMSAFTDLCEHDFLTLWVEYEEVITIDGEVVNLSVRAERKDVRYSVKPTAFFFEIPVTQEYTQCSRCGDTSPQQNMHCPNCLNPKEEPDGN